MPRQEPACPGGYIREGGTWRRRVLLAAMNDRELPT